MERRQSDREPVEGVVELTCLSSDSGSTASLPRPIRIMERSELGLKIETMERVAPSSLVRLDFPDGLVLGEVMWCAKVGDYHHAGLKLNQSLQHIGDLRKLVAALLGTDVRRPLYQSQTVESGCD